MIEENNSPAFENAAYVRQKDDLNIVSDCFRGTSAVQARAQSYLPKGPAEDQRTYDARLGVAEFWNAYRHTVEGLVGMIFRKPPVLGEDVPSEIKKHLENVDLQGTHVDVFAKRVETAAANDGHTFILVDMPPPLEEGTDAATERAAGRRPYWIHYNKEQVINWRTVTVNGRVVPTQVTIREVVCEPDGEFGEKEVVQYRVLRPGEWHLYRPKDEKEADFDVTSGKTSLPEIPLVCINLNPVGWFESDPPLIGVARENLRLYRLQSQLDHNLRIALIPILAAIGRPNTDEPLKVGPGFLVDLPQDADLKYVEHSGKAIGSAQGEIAKAKDNIAALGLAILAQAPKVQKTATESVIESEAETSELSNWSRALQDGLEQALMYHAAYLSQPDGGSIGINRDFATKTLDAQKIAALWSVAKEGGWTYETFWSMLAKADELPEDFDPKTERAALDAEKEANASLTNRMLNQFSQGLDGNAFAN